MKERQWQADVAVVGSGPGGATVARELSRAGKRVVLLEMGRDWRRNPLYGTYTGCLLYTDKGGMLFSEEGLNIIRGILTGGSTNLYCGTASRPPEWLKKKYGVDTDECVDQTIEELRIRPLPAELMGKSSLRVLEAANELGLGWEPYPKFMDPDRCPHGFDCGADCMLGCRCKAKWTANEYLDQARVAGCTLVTRARVEEVIIEGGVAAGVRGRLGRRRPFSVRAGTVVLCAGGLGDPLILQRSGFPEAGRGLLMDPTIMVYGVHRGEGTSTAPPMAVGSYDDTHGFILSHL
ncbi:MAG: GMC family oxidoreductase N-terminal domain-containing protein, partial [bacterium]